MIVNDTVLESGHVVLVLTLLITKGIVIILTVGILIGVVNSFVVIFPVSHELSGFFNILENFVALPFCWGDVVFVIGGLDLVYGDDLCVLIPDEFSHFFRLIIITHRIAFTPVFEVITHKQHS